MPKTTQTDFEAVRKEALEFLMVNTTAVIATSADNMPQASTIYYIVDEDFNFYFATEADTKKYVNISGNPQVAIVVGTGPSHISVSVQGKAELIRDEEKEAVTQRLIDLMMRNNVNKWPIEDMEKFKKSGMATFVVVPERITFMNLDDVTYPNSKSNTYVTILPRP
jgi:nitroimidazol reductase NimA-like FMN-containing flavoprotein (pyridoxamine 5'-phosphate oxidase superfamily)